MSLTVLLAVAFVGAALYYVCPLRLRWVLLLLLSYGFYLTCGLSALPFIALTTLTTWAGALVIARVDDRYELLPRVAADKVRERDAGMIVLDHGQPADAAAPTSEDDDYYAQFKVPDDLMW